MDSGNSSWRERAASIERGWIIAAAIVAILIGVFLLIQPASGLVTVAVLFGVYLVVSGVCTFAFAIARRDRSTGYRWWRAILGVLVVIAGIACLVNLFRSLQFLGFTLGVGLVFVGIAELMNYDRAEGRPVALRVISGVLTILAGIVMFFAPLISVEVIVFISALVLIVTGVAAFIALPTLLPKSGRARSTDLPPGGSVE
jgi:uncharacterized membrane protein HdeD (DUF308 family)